MGLAGLLAPASLTGDGQGGLLLAWSDRRAGILESDIYIQRLDPAGNEMWGEDGLGLCLNPEGAQWPSIAPDGSGGAWVVWQDGRDTRPLIYGKHVSAAGVTMWLVGRFL